jgi:hypothetical protein
VVKTANCPNINLVNLPNCRYNQQDAVLTKQEITSTTFDAHILASLQVLMAPAMYWLASSSESLLKARMRMLSLTHSLVLKKFSVE